MQSLQESPKDFAQQFVKSLREHFPDDLLESSILSGNYAKYQQDPVGFCEEELGEVFTDGVKAMLESVRDYDVTVAMSGNATGKTHGAARGSAWFYKSFGEVQVYTAAAPPESNLKNLLWGEINSVVAKHPEIFEGDRPTTMRIERSPQDFITGVTIPSSGTVQTREAKFSGKHRANLLFVVDEGDAVPDEVFKGIESCMSGGNARLLVMFNPRQRAGAAYRMIREGRANVVHLSAMDHPNVVLGEDIFPGAVTRAKTVQRVNKWCRPLGPDEGIDGLDTFELPDFLVGKTARMEKGGEYPPLQAGDYVIMDPAFAYMVLGRYPAADVAQLISQEWVNSARARWDAYVAQHGEVPPKGVRPTQGLDVAVFGSDSNVQFSRYGGFLARPDHWQGLDPLETGERAAKGYEKDNAAVIYVDAIGVGASVAPQLRRANCVAHGITSSNKPTRQTEDGKFNHMRDQLMWTVREHLRLDQGAMLPPCEELLEELVVPTYSLDNGKIKVMSTETIKDLLGRSPDYLAAYSMTFGGESALDPLSMAGCLE